MILHKVSLLIVLAIIFVLQPRDAQSQTPNSVKSNSCENQTPTTHPPPLAVEKEAHKDQQQSDKVASESKAEPVQITSIPKVSIESKKDLYDKVLVVATSLLVLVGGFQIFYLWRTVAVAQAAAGAAKVSADAVINSERAWLLLGDFTEERHNFKPEGLNLFLTFRNYGKTPAWVVEYCFHCVRVPKESPGLPRECFNPEIIPFGEPVPPDKPYPRICAPVMLAEELVGRPHEPSALIFFGYIKYQDVFYRTTKELRVTYVRMRFERTQHDIIMDNPGRWVYDGPAEANWST